MWQHSNIISPIISLVPFSVINLTELAIKRIIKMAKQIFSFSQLCQEDQVALLKGGCIELMVLR